MKIYLDTSIYGSYYEKERSVELIDCINNNKSIIVYYSYITRHEFSDAHVSVKWKLLRVLKSIKRKRFIKRSARAKALATNYLAMGILPIGSQTDAQHIAVASVNKIDYVLSLNYKHMVGREKLFIEANKLLNVHPIKIIKPDKFLTLWQ